MKAIVTIKQPCSEKWGDMASVNDGRFCNTCAHEVIDFSNWELADVVQYLQQAQQEKVCGRFRDSQLNKPVELTAFLPEVLHWQGNLLTKIAALIVICFGLTFTSCNNKNPEEIQKLQIAQPLRSTKTTLGNFQLAIPPDTVLIEDAIQVPAPEPIVHAPEPAYYSHTLGLPAVERVVVAPLPDTSITEKKIYRPIGRLWSK